MAARSRTRSARSSHPPLWLVEGLDVVQRKVVPLGVTVAVVVLGATVVAWLAPGLLPPTPLVGAVVGLAALLLGLAAAVATDTSELTVRGPRHVAAAGGELVAVLPREPSVAAAGPLASAIIEVREPGSPLLLAFATASRDARRANAWTEAIARALVAQDSGVLRVDLASGRTDHEGLLEVVRDGKRLVDVVSFEPGVKLAELAAGQDHAQALASLTELPARLPRDLDILLVALPTATSRAVVAAASALDHVLIVAERDRTSRVDLIASLEALSAAGTQAQVVLLDTPTAMRLAPPVVADPGAEADQRRGIASIVGTAPVVAAGSDGQPVAVPEGEEPDTELPTDVVVDRAEDADPAQLDEIDLEVAPEPDVGVEPASAGVEVAPAPDGDDVDPRDTAMLAAAAAATALSIADAEQDRTDEPAHQHAPDAAEPAHQHAPDVVEPTGEAPAEAPAAAAEPLAGPAPSDGGPVDTEEALPVAGEEPRIEGVVQLEFDGDVRPDEVVAPEVLGDEGDEPDEPDEPDVGDTAASAGSDDTAASAGVDADATDRLPRLDADGDPAARDPGHDVHPDPFDAADEDLLHTTARLAILTQDVADRDADEHDHLGAPDVTGADGIAHPADAAGTHGTDREDIADATEATDEADDDRWRDAGA